MRRRPQKSKRPSPKAETTTVSISRLDAQGIGVGDEIRVPFTLPDEKWRITKSGTQILNAEEVVLSPARKVAPCRHFGWSGGSCGGCLLQHFGLEESAQWKRERVRQALGAAMELPDHIGLYQTPINTRRRARLGFVRTGGRWRYGFRSYRRNDIVPMSECFILHPDLIKFAESLATSAQDLLGRTLKSFDAHITLCDNGLDVDIRGADDGDMNFQELELLSTFAKNNGCKRITFDGTVMFCEQQPIISISGLPTPFPTAGFLQASREGQHKLQTYVCEAIEGCKTIADLFCGIGTFSIPASNIAAITAIDSDQSAINCLTQTAKSRNIEPACRDLFQNPLSSGELSGFDAVIIDPPRAGAKAQFAEIAAAQVPKIVAVSCNPDSLARDIKSLSGEYRAESVDIVDQFIWSSHIEVVVVLNRLAQG